MSTEPNPDERIPTVTTHSTPTPARLHIAEVDERRGHAFVSKTAFSRVPALYATEETPLSSKVLHVHYFFGAWDWYVAEYDPDTGLAFGFVTSDLLPEGEWGYFNVFDLGTQLVPGPGGYRFPIERDLYWDKVKASEL